MILSKLRPFFELPTRLDSAIRKLDALHHRVNNLHRGLPNTSRLETAIAFLSDKVGVDNALSSAATRHNATIRSDYSYLLGKLGIEISPEAMNQEATYQDHSPLAKAIDSIDYLKQKRQ